MRIYIFYYPTVIILVDLVIFAQIMINITIVAMPAIILTTGTTFNKVNLIYQYTSEALNFNFFFVSLII
ncbi:Hypothetical protein FNO222_0971 [Francisella orientalis]|uniref:Uncharacterized protein n=1 Tax=Francisella orientalis TaxID=299583 RepID=A0ABM5U713_9GAMM|nr:hypothetical protein FNO12_0963 [Francisella orientalis FNO12]AKN87161.1 Hypothetical protein FNO24_0965 [Francisella orientalis FNO24]AKN88698.1 Hypothetical protein FNO190_0963 [Francisella orientalis]AKU05456.1 Hypothetical protein FNO01_0963 [Francisella orientalis]QEN20368.1 Hypothetical protein FNO39_0971 [Francisella orientalis]